ncbi:DNA-binding transcriptional regulator, GntR family [Paenibacillus algorifonticola]|uniref:DNA-binding transcriptional regulator, GntR family n=1 Tax=Paenibacillus algorifonticola TaxID=684063 RepID=A0A1I2GU55_9BACL|nr:GntR family transcriptional regulator [Paenibacillus algorifonticola]SFF21165.1 DNA-binding transcriptional regulator, GntR family [Paenibacillus algorifonticola]
MHHPTDTELNRTTYSRVCKQLREDILSGFFEPGVRLRIVELTNRYQVSQMPIREALQQLQGEGLIILNPQKGASVREVDEQFVMNMYDIRIAIETMLAQKGVIHLTDHLYNELSEIEDNYEKAVHNTDTTSALQWNEKLHRKINDLANNPEAVQIINRHWGLIDSMRHQFGFSEIRIAETIQEHRLLLQALKQRDADMVAQVTLEHVTKAKNDLINRMKLRNQ